KTNKQKNKMKFALIVFSLIFHQHIAEAQTLKRIDGSTISSASLTSRVQQLMQAANVSGVAISVFNHNKAVYSKTFGLADVQNKIPLAGNSEMYAASFAKTVFAYVVMQLLDEKVFDLDKPLVEY